VYDAAQDVVISCETPGAVIRYTTNGNDPTENDPIIASGRTVRVANTLVLKAKAWGSALSSSNTAVQTTFLPSPVKAANYTINLKPADTEAPTIDVSAPLQNQTYTSLAGSFRHSRRCWWQRTHCCQGRLMRYSDGYYWNGSAWTAQAVDLPTGGTVSTWTCAFPSLADGHYAFLATAQDRAGNMANSPLISFAIATTPVVTPTPCPRPCRRRPRRFSILLRRT
jgi:hypothetical protein